MEVTSTIAGDPASLSLALEGQINVSRRWLDEHPDAPRLYAAGVRYTREPPGRERWQTIGETYATKEGDCEDLVIARVAELRHRDGELAARAHVYRTGSGTLHTVVRRANGALEDPSRILGMGRDKRAAKRARKAPMAGDDETPSKAKVTVTPTEDGYRGELKWRGASYVITVVGLATSKGAAIERTAEIAGRIFAGLNAQRASSPDIVALLPPQAQLAITAARTIGKLARSGKLRGILGKLKGPARKLAAAVASER